MNSFERWFIKRVIAKEVRQGYHDNRVEGLYGLIREAVTAEFTEDNAPTIDARGSDLFEAICRQPEYYATRAERLNRVRTDKEYRVERRRAERRGVKSHGLLLL